MEEGKLGLDKIYNFSQNGENGVRDLFISGVISYNSWFSDDVVPNRFKTQLFAGKGKLNLWLSSPGGVAVAGFEIYNLLKLYKDEIVAHIYGIAASAASVIAMAADKIIMSPVSTMLIHDPWTETVGDVAEHKSAVNTLKELKEAIINAYESKTGLPRSKISSLMETETTMSPQVALALGFADGIETFDIKQKNVENNSDIVKTKNENKIKLLGGLNKCLN